MPKTILVTGAAGFIGFHLSKLLLGKGYRVLGIDNLNDYYDVNIKLARLEILKKSADFQFEKVDLADKTKIMELFATHKPQKVVSLAAQAGVRYSIENPHAYIEANIVGFLNILEACRFHTVEHCVYASSSSVYGGNTQLPFSIHHNVDHPVSLYAATKKANELMAHTYSHLFQVPTTGLRFFTVYGPWGRPDMALFKFTKNILAGLPIDVYNHGNHRRDFTYIDDIVEGVFRVMEKPATANPNWSSDHPDCATSSSPYRVYNIGHNEPVELLRFIKAIEDNLGKKAILNLLPLQAGDVPDSHADVDDLIRDVGFKPQVAVEEGIPKFLEWYKSYFKA